MEALTQKRGRLLIAWAAPLLATIGLLAPAADAGPQTAELGVSLTKRIDRALFLVETADGGGGSGFLFGDRKTIVTNRHVVLSDSATKNPIGNLVTVFATETGPEGFVRIKGKGHKAVVCWVHPSQDLAVLELDEPVEGQPLQIKEGDGRRLRPRGTEVWAHGIPATLGSPTVSKGIIAGHKTTAYDLATYYVSDVAISPGSSGGPVTDSKGYLIGVSTLGFDEAEVSGWSGLVPARVVAAMFPAGGGASDIQRIVLEDKVREVQSSRSLDRRIERARAALDEVLQQAIVPDEVAEAYRACLGAALDGASPVSAEESLKAFVYYADAAARTTARIRMMGWSPGTQITEKGTRDIFIAEAEAGKWTELKAFNWAFAEDEQGERELARFAAGLADEVDQGSKSLHGAGETFGRYMLAIHEDNNPEGVVQSEVQEAIRILFRAKVLMGIAQEIVGAFLAEGAPLSEPMKTLKRKGRMAHQRWLRVPLIARESSYGLSHEEALERVEVLAEGWKAAGMEVANDRVGALQSGGAWELTVEVTEDYFLINAYAIADPPADIDLYVKGPDGVVYFADDEVDHYPMAVDFPVVSFPGTWTVVIQSEALERCEVKAEIYTY